MLLDDGWTLSLEISNQAPPRLQGIAHAGSDDDGAGKRDVAAGYQAPRVIGRGFGSFRKSRGRLAPAGVPVARDRPAPQVRDDFLRLLQPAQLLGQRQPGQPPPLRPGMPLPARFPEFFIGRIGIIDHSGFPWILLEHRGRRCPR